MAPNIDPKELVDARWVATRLGLSHPNSVTTYLRRYPEMPRPVVDLGRGRSRLFLKSEIEAWADQRRVRTRQRS